MFYDSMMYVIKVTDDCFMRCPYCMVDEEFEKTEMSIDTFKNILNKSIGMNKVIISFVGGEPLMRGIDWYKEVFDYAKQFQFDNICKVEFQMFTNGVLLNDEWIKLLVDDNKVGIFLSYDGKDKGAKGRKKSQRIVKKYADKFAGVNIVVNSSNHNAMLEIFKELEGYGVKRVMNYLNIYEHDKSEMFADGVIEVFKYIDETKPKIRFVTYDDAKRVMKYCDLGKTNNISMGRVFMNNDYVIHTDGTIKAGVPQTTNDEFIYGNINEIEHIIDAVFSPNNIKHNKDFIRTLGYLGEYRLENLLTRGGGFFWDKSVTGQRMDVPNLPVLPYYRKIFGYMKENHL